MLVLLATLHWVYWYGPRPRPTKPDIRGIPASLFDDAEFDVAVWLAYPHQNLSALERRTGDLQDLLASAARLSRMPPPRLPRLGPFRFPPASEMVWAASADGERWRLAVRMYPLPSLLVRAAGLVASNPWLKGGPVRSAGKTLYVEWRGRSWNLGTDPLDSEPATASRAGSGENRELTRDDPELALIRLRSHRGPFPPGLYRLRLQNRGLQITMGHLSAVTPATVGSLPGKNLALAVVHRLKIGPRRGVEALAVTGGNSGDSLRLPSAAIVRRGGLNSLRLPGESSLRRIGIRPQSERMGEWEIISWDDTAMVAGRRLIPGLEQWASGSEAGVVGLRMNVATVGGWAADFGAGLRDLPLVGPEMAQRWVDLARIASACGPRARLTGVIESTPPAVELRLESPSSSPAGR